MRNLQRNQCGGSVETGKEAWSGKNSGDHSAGYGGALLFNFAFFRIKGGRSNEGGIAYRSKTGETEKMSFLCLVLYHLCKCNMRADTPVRDGYSYGAYPIMWSYAGQSVLGRRALSSI